MANFLKYKLDYVLIVLLSFPILFLKLGSFSLRLWDESIYATNSIEMMERGEWIVPYFNGEMDYWNTKPPMINWLQIISMKIFGINEFAIRFPSALAALGTILLVYWFLKKHFSNMVGMIGSMVLLTSVGFVTYHGARTGDTDTILTFFITAANLFLLDSILIRNISTRKAILIGGLMVAAFFTKSIASLLFLPGLTVFLFLFENAQFLSILRSKLFWFVFIFFLGSAIGLILIRDFYQPGYLKVVFNDARRIDSVVESHSHPVSFYVDNLVNSRYSFWILFLMTSFLLLFFPKENDKRNRIIRFSSCISVFYFTIVTFSSTKMAWYDIPLFPLFALNIALLLQMILENLKLSAVKSVIAAVILFFLPYKHVFGLSQTNHFVEFEQKNEVRERYLFHLYNTAPGEILKGKTRARMIVFNNRYERALKFYQAKFSSTQLDLIISDIPELKSGDMFVIEEELLNDSICPVNRLILKDSFENLNIYKVK